VLEKNYVFYKSIFIVHNESIRGYYLFETYDDFEFWYYNLDDKTIHKVIFGHNPQQLKFNIDASKEFIDGLNVDAQDKGKYILESIIDAIPDVMQTYYWKMTSQLLLALALRNSLLTPSSRDTRWKTTEKLHT